MFKIDQNGTITRIADGKVIPRDITNIDYQTYIYILENGVDPQTHNRVNVSSNYRSV